MHPQETLFQLDDPWIASKKDTKSYIHKHLDNIKLLIYQYLPTSIINYVPHIDNMFTILPIHFIDNFETLLI